MAYLKSIILLIFCIGWVKAVQFDFEAKFNQFSEQLKTSFEKARKWIEEVAYRNFTRIKEIFQSGRMSARWYNSQNDIPDQTENTKIPLKTTPVPQISKNDPNSTDRVTIGQSSESEIGDNSPAKESTEDQTHLETKTEAEIPLKDEAAKSELKLTTVAPVPQISKTSQNTNDLVTAVQSSESEIGDNSSAKESTKNQTHLGAKTEAEIPLKDEAAKSELKLTTVAPVPQVSKTSQNATNLVTTGQSSESEIDGNSSAKESTENQTHLGTKTEAEIPLRDEAAKSELKLTTVAPVPQISKTSQNATNLVTTIQSSESEIGDNSSAKESTENQTHLGAKTEAEIPLKDEAAKSKLESTILQDVGEGDSQDIPSEPEPDFKIKIIEPIIEKESKILVSDPPESFEFETKRELPSIYKEQNIIISFLFFLIVLMSIYFFLLDRTRNCPTIIIQRDLCGNLKPVAMHFKK